MIIPFILGYAEIHYHIRKLFPAYYSQFPEIIADLPSRFITKASKKLPLLIIIKDSHLFPIELISVTVKAKNTDFEIEEIFPLNLKLEEHYFSRILPLDLNNFGSDSNLQLDVQFLIRKKGKEYRFINDNYDLPYKPFNCYLSSQGLPHPENWYAGDAHYHSVYTEDQVEFGADIPSTMEMAKALGLSWFFVTDHSYDLDDSLDNFTRNDPELPKWSRLQKEVNGLNDKAVKVIAGEEVSIGNCKGYNVHLLAVNHKHFIIGSGDGAENWFRNKPENFILNIPEIQNDNNLFIAAHPWEKVPLIQRLTLRRDTWHPKDLRDGNISFLQIINESDLKAVQRNISKWVSLLLQGNKYQILAGNDAHGNFNFMKQIKVPFLKLFSSRKQIFGHFHTLFHYKSNDPIKGLKQGRIIVSNGPFIDVTLTRNGETSYIGNSIKSGKAVLNYVVETTSEFGEIRTVKLIFGDLKRGSETIRLNPESGKELELPVRGYVRMELFTSLEGFAATNPIWIEA